MGCKVRYVCISNILHSPLSTKCIVGLQLPFWFVTSRFCRKIDAFLFCSVLSNHSTSIHAVFDVKSVTHLCCSSLMVSYIVITGSLPKLT